MTHRTNKVIKRLLYDQQKQWHNENNWSIFQDHLLSKGVTSYRHPTTTTAGLDDKVVFLGDENQINHFNANPADIAKNIMVSRNGPQWEQLGEVIPGENNTDKSGYSVALSDNGSILAIGSRDNDDNGSNSGHVRVYEYSENEEGNYGWNQLGEDIDGEAAGDNSGHSVSLSADGSILAIGAYRNGNDSGQVRIYQFRQFKDGDNFNYQSRTHNNDNLPLIITENVNTAPVTGKYYWTQLGLDIDGTNNEKLGWSVSLSADGLVVAVGSTGLDLNTDSFFTVYKYYVKDNVLAWHKFGQEFGTPGDGATLSLSSDGSVVAIGQNLYENSRGKVIVYQYNNNADKWDKLGSDILGEAETNNSGWSLSLSADGSILAIGAYFNDSASGDYSGHVRVYKYRKYNSSNDAGNFHHTSTEVNSTQILPLIITEPNTDPEDGQFYWTQVGLDIDGVNGELDMTGYSVSLNDDGSILAIGAPLSSANGLNTGYVSVYRLENNIWNLIGGSIIGSLRDKCGHSVSLNADGSILAIGCINGDGNIVNTQTYKGHVRVFQIAKRNTWVQQGLDIDGENAGDFSGYSVSLSANGSTMAIGAILNKGSNNIINLGHVRVYEDINGLWKQKGADIDGEAVIDYSGSSVSLSGDGSILAIGALENDENGSNSGHVRVFEYREYKADDIDENGVSKFHHASTSVNSNQNKPLIITGDSNTPPQEGNFYWIQVGKDIDGENEGDQSGNYVSLSNDGLVVAIGAHKNNGNGTESGHVRVYQYNGSSWEQKGLDIDGETTLDSSGRSVSLSDDGSIVAIGAAFNDGDNKNLSGHVRVFEYREYTANDEENGVSKFHYESRIVGGEQTKPLIITGDNNLQPNVGQSYWIQKGIDIDGEAPTDYSGISVSLSADGSVVAIGSPYNDTNESNSGHVRIYEYVNSSWVQKGGDIQGEAADEASGHSVSLSADGSIVAISARENNGDGNFSRLVRIYEFTNNIWIQKGGNIDGEGANDVGVINPEQWGTPVSLSDDGSIVAIGAWRNDGNGNDSGHVRVYKFTGWGLGA